MMEIIETVFKTSGFKHAYFVNNFIYIYYTEIVKRNS